MPEIGPQMGGPPRVESPGEADQREASSIVQGFKLYLRMDLTQDAVATLVADFKRWWRQNKPKQEL